MKNYQQITLTVYEQQDIVTASIVDGKSKNDNIGNALENWFSLS